MSLLADLKRYYKAQIRAVELFPKPTSPKYIPNSSLSLHLRKILKEWNIKGLYEHQYLAIEAARAKKDVFLTTPTGSGKSLVYQILLKEALLKKPNSKALYISPLKALAQDQRARFLTYNISSELYDGDTPSSLRKKIRGKLPSVILTNPDMLHLAILPFHGNWKELFTNLNYVILDEVHVYSGSFGSHVACIFRRLLRLLSIYQSKPQFILLSAYFPSKKAEFYSAILGKDKKNLEIIEESTAPCIGKNFLLWQPKRSSIKEALLLLKLCIKAGLRTIVFIKSRRTLEFFWQEIKEEGLSSYVAPYRAGYSPSLRREVEAKLFKGEINAVVATSALELGIDIGSLEVCILVGYPGTMLSTLHRAGRVGRWLEEETPTKKIDLPLVILIGEDDALDQYFLTHPEEFFSLPPEDLILDSGNLEILEQHVLCAAAEYPLDEEEATKFFPESFWSALGRLYLRGKLKKDTTQFKFQAKTSYPHRRVNIRGVGETYDIIEETDWGAHFYLGSIDSARLLYECHPEAIYIHSGNYYRVTNINRGKVLVKATGNDYYTEPLVKEELKVITQVSSQKLSPLLNLGYAMVEVKESVIGYLIKERKRGGIIKEVIFDTPYEEKEPYITYALYMTPPSGSAWEGITIDLPGGMHALEHALIASAPFFILCSRDDLGGRSYIDYLPFWAPAIFIYDAHPQGLGISNTLYQKFLELGKKTLILIRDCRCKEDTGCPSCIQSPKCGNKNRPLSKLSAIRLLESILNSIKESKLSSTKAYSKIFFSLETKYLAQEVGGWENKAKLGLALGVVYSPQIGFRVYKEESIEELLSILTRKNIVIGFNLKDFHFKVLEAYYKDWERIPIIDILEYAESKLSIRLPFAAFVEATLNKLPPLSGEEVVRLYRLGKEAEVEKNCCYKVKLLAELYEFAQKNKCLYYKTKDNLKFKLPWELS